MEKEINFQLDMDGFASKAHEETFEKLVLHVLYSGDDTGTSVLSVACDEHNLMLTIPIQGMFDLNKEFAARIRAIDEQQKKNEAKVVDIAWYPQ